MRSAEQDYAMTFIYTQNRLSLFIWLMYTTIYD